jgi:hypothetical protein
MKIYKSKWVVTCILAIMLCTGYAVKAAPSNDSCYNAMPIVEVSNLAFDTTNASFDGAGYFITSPNIWYKYTATGTREITISLCGSEYDTKLAVYLGGECYPSSEQMIASNDDSCGWQSEVTLNVTAGQSYLIEVGGYGSNKGHGVMNFIYEAQLSNDNCQDALEIGDVEDMPFDTSEATSDGVGLCVQGSDIWYIYTAPCTGKATISTCGSSFDTVIAVFRSIECPPLQKDMIGCNDDSCGQQSELTIDVQAGSRYLIEVGGFNNLSKGSGVLTITCGAGEEPPNPFDLGDAPDSSNNYSVSMSTYPSAIQARFPTVFNDGKVVGPYGPVHLDASGVAFLGERVTHESEADIGPDQDGINNISPLLHHADQDQGDDGVIFPINMPNCKWTTFDYIVNVVTPNTDMYVNVWFDWNRDGDWNDSTATNPMLISPNGVINEWAVQNQLLFNLSAGQHQITTPAFLSWHPAEGFRNIWMRITLSGQPWKGGSGAGGSGPAAGYAFGETEDYYFTPETSCDICEDTNGDGVINMNDLIAYVNQWLDICQ